VENEYPVATGMVSKMQGATEWRKALIEEENATGDREGEREQLDKGSEEGEGSGQDLTNLNRSFRPHFDFQGLRSKSMLNQIAIKNNIQSHTSSVYMIIHLGGVILLKKWILNL
jgi:hypothetical protein